MKGVDQVHIKDSIEKIKKKQIEPDFVSALKLCKRRRLGPLRPEGNRELFYKKDMGILARGGFRKTSKEFFFCPKGIHYTPTGDNPHAACPSRPRWGGPGGVAPPGKFLEFFPVSCMFVFWKHT